MAMFRFHISRQRAAQEIDAVRSAVRSYVRYAPNQGGDETPRENIRGAFYFLRCRVDRDSLLYAAVAELERVSYSMMDM